MTRYFALPLSPVAVGSPGQRRERPREGPAVGAPAPEFKLQDQNGKWHELKDYRGKWVALYFYPKDQTPGCTTQACDFATTSSRSATPGGDSRRQRRRRRIAQEVFRKARPAVSILADADKVTAKDYGVLKRFLGTVDSPSATPS